MPKCYYFGIRVSSAARTAIRGRHLEGTAPVNAETDIKALRYFVAVAQRGSYSRASAHLRITQPAITRQIQAIEKQYGMRLFRREGRGVELTEAGRVLFEQARDIIERMELINSMMDVAANEPSGRLTIGVTAAVAKHLIPDAILRYRKKYPRVLLQVQEGSSSDLMEMLADGKIDLALTYAQARRAAATMLPLLDVQIGLVAPPAKVLGRKDPLAGRKRLTLAEAAAFPLILQSRANSMRIALEQACGSVGAVPNIALESESLALSLELIKAGGGYMLMGYVAVHEEVTKGELRFVPIVPPDMKWRMSLAFRGMKAQSIAGMAMATEIKESMRLAIREGRWHGKLLI
ncbi:LysR family transcriptional regulator [Bordetella petrii]|nr:LysR family transcriptional regulator [Bordetella petrii]